MTRRRSTTVNDVTLELLESGPDDGPPVILSHGFPEGAHSWRHQLEPLGAAGFHAIAPDQRGYGWSTAPKDVDAYGIEQLSGDLLGLLDETAHDQGVFVGHDWGALIVWELAKLHPERVRAVVGVSVPLVQWPGPPTDVLRAIAGGRFHYILYFQDVGPAEAELEADTYRTMARTLYGASGDGFAGLPSEPPPVEGTGFLDLFPDPPSPLPAWLTEDAIETYAAGFRQSGFFGPLSYYRNLDANYGIVQGLSPELISMPSFFIGGDRDAVIVANPTAVDAMKAVLPDLRGAVLLPGVGHWTQQEAPEAFNEALLGFLRTL